MHGYHLFDKWMNEQRDKLAGLELFDVFVQIIPIGKGRARENFRTPEKTRLWENYVAQVVAEEMRDQPTIWFDCAARILVGLHGNRTPDIDNWEKAVWDSLQKGDDTGRFKAINNDRLVRGYVEKAEINVAKGEEFVWVRFYARNRGDFVLWSERAHADYYREMST